MLPILAYIGCLFAIAPAATFALYFWGVSRVANSGSWSALGKLLWQLVELIGSPGKLVAMVLVLLAIVVAGCFRSTRPVGCIVLGLLGAVSIVQVLFLDRSAQAWLWMTPSFVAVTASFGWAWQMMSSELV